jgi:hypothetical protein
MIKNVLLLLNDMFIPRVLLQLDIGPWPTGKAHLGWSKKEMYEGGNVFLGFEIAVLELRLLRGRIVEVKLWQDVSEL